MTLNDLQTVYTFEDLEHFHGYLDALDELERKKAKLQARQRKG